DQALVGQFVGATLGRVPEPPEEALGGHLNQYAGLHPALQALAPLLKKRIPLWMRDNRNQSGVLHALKDIFRVVEDNQVRKLHEQIAETVDTILPRILQGVLDVVVHQVEVAT